MKTSGVYVQTGAENSQDELQSFGLQLSAGNEMRNRGN